MRLNIGYSLQRSWDSLGDATAENIVTNVSTISMSTAAISDNVSRHTAPDGKCIFFTSNIKCTGLWLLSTIGLITSCVDSNKQQNKKSQNINKQLPNQSHAALSAVTSYAILLKIQGSTFGFNMRHLPVLD